MTQDEITRAFEKISVNELEGLLKHAQAQRAEFEALKGKTNKEMIEFYLNYKAKTDLSLAAKYPNNPQNKTIEQCLTYIQNQASKVKNGNCAMVHHSIVFEWAEEFFKDDSIKTPEKKTTPTYTPKKMTREETIAAIEKWEKEHQTRVDEWIKKHEDKSNKWEADHKKKIEKWNAEHMQFSLFGDSAQETCPYLDEKNPYNSENNPFAHETCPYKLDDKVDKEPETNSPNEDDIDSDDTEDNKEENND